MSRTQNTDALYGRGLPTMFVRNISGPDNERWKNPQKYFYGEFIAGNPSYAIRTCESETLTLTLLNGNNSSSTVPSGEVVCTSFEKLIKNLFAGLDKDNDVYLTFVLT